MKRCPTSRERGCEKHSVEYNYDKSRALPLGGAGPGSSSEEQQAILFARTDLIVTRDRVRIVRVRVGTEDYPRRCVFLTCPDLEKQGGGAPELLRPVPKMKYSK